MDTLIIDVEVTTNNKGNPFDTNNKLVMVGLQSPTKTTIHTIEHNTVLEPYKKKIDNIQHQIDSATWLITFNGKFDLHWLRKYGVKFQDKLIWDVQLAHFINVDQSLEYPSLNDVCEFYGHSKKLDHIKINYWDKGINTDEIPIDELTTYLKQDLEITGLCYNSQQSIKDSKKKLIKLAGLDLLTLEEIEYNGILYDIKESLERSDTCRTDIDSIVSNLNAILGSGNVNYNSTDHRSVILYGGVIEEEIRTPFFRKDGTPSQRMSVAIKKHHFPRLVTPLVGSELKKSGYFSTDEGTLKKLKANGKAKHIIKGLQQLANISRLRNTYYEGIPNLMREMNWGNTIHGNLNQCVAITGRLSSNKPNLQNNPPEIDSLFRSRYDYKI